MMNAVERTGRQAGKLSGSEVSGPQPSDGEMARRKRTRAGDVRKTVPPAPVPRARDQGKTLVSASVFSGDFVTRREVGRRVRG